SQLAFRHAEIAERAGNAPSRMVADEQEWGRPLRVQCDDRGRFIGREKAGHAKTPRKETSRKETSRNWTTAGCGFIGSPGSSLRAAEWGCLVEIAMFLGC